MLSVNELSKHFKLKKKAKTDFQFEVLLLNNYREEDFVLLKNNGLVHQFQSIPYPSEIGVLSNGFFFIEGNMYIFIKPVLYNKNAMSPSDAVYSKLKEYVKSNDFINNITISSSIVDLSKIENLKFH